MRFFKNTPKYTSTIAMLPYRIAPFPDSSAAKKLDGGSEKSIFPQTMLAIEGVLAVLIEGRWSPRGAAEASKCAKLLLGIGQTRCHLQKHTAKLMFFGQHCVLAERGSTF